MHALRSAEGFDQAVSGMRRMNNYRGPGVYQHYKGTYYLVLGRALVEADMSPVIVYMPLEPSPTMDSLGAGYWTRPEEDFDAQVKRPNGTTPRFQKTSHLMMLPIFVTQPEAKMLDETLAQVQAPQEHVSLLQALRGKIAGVLNALPVVVGR